MTLRPMTPADLLRAVREITAAPGPAVAMGAAIYPWLADNGIDPGAGRKPRNPFFWKADHANAPTPLRKFKAQKAGWTMSSGEAPCSHTGDNGWCLVERWDDACEWTMLQRPVWRATPWCSTCGNWIFECSALVKRGTGLVGFDARVLKACAFGPKSHQEHP